jgi:mRNA interferase MazF
MKQTIIKRGDIFWIDFDPAKGTEIQKKRPALVCSHDIMNENSSRIIVAPVTSNLKKIYSFEYALKDHLDVKGKIMLDQIRAVDKSRLGDKLGDLSLKEMQEVESILKFVLGIQSGVFN